MRLVFNATRGKFELVLTPLEILTGLLTVDGAGSGLDADLLDGQHASAFGVLALPNVWTQMNRFNANVGINIDPAVAGLHVYIPAATSIIRLERGNTNISYDNIIARLEGYSNDADAPGVCAKLEIISEGSGGETGWRWSNGIAGLIAETMRLDYMGNLGIGTVSPDANLHLEFVAGSTFRLTRKDTAVGVGDMIGRFEFETQDSENPGIGAVIQAEADGTSGEVGLVFQTGRGGTVSERMRINSSGTVTIGDGTNQAQFAADGELTLAGTARVYMVIPIRPSGFSIPGTKPAVSVEHGIGMSWEFSDATDDTVEAEIQLPQDMDRSVAPEFNIGWDSDTADPGNDSKQCVWQLEYLYLSLNEDVTAAAQETLPVTTSASTTVNGLVVSTITGLDLPSAADRFMMIRIKRLGADAADTLGDVAYLNGCGLKYTKNKLGVAL